MSWSTGNRTYSVAVIDKTGERNLYGICVSWSTGNRTYSVPIIDKQGKKTCRFCFISDLMQNQPVARPGTAKYNGYNVSSKGWYSANSFPGLTTLSTPYLNALIASANNALSEKTWLVWISVNPN